MGRLPYCVLWPRVVDKLCHGEVIGPLLLLFRDPEAQVLFNLLVGMFTGTICAWVESSANILFDVEEARKLLVMHSN
jgi:hypothetical protein